MNRRSKGIGIFGILSEHVDSVWRREGWNEVTKTRELDCN